jgi:hypothetical protein
MAFTPANVAAPAHNHILDNDDVAYYTDASGNLVPMVIAVVPNSSNVLTSIQSGATMLTTDLQVNPASTIDGLSRPPFFTSAGGQKVPVLALCGFDAAKNLLPPVLSTASVTLGNFATGGSIGLAPATVDNASTIFVAQTTASQTITLPSPTETAIIRRVIVGNTGSVAVTLLGQSVAAGAALEALWSGSAWMYVA